MKKRGAIEIQLNWIFVLIAGIVIFSFFITIANKQKEASENRVAMILKKNIDTFIKASETGENSYKQIDLPESNIKFTCDSRGVSNFDVNNKGLTEDLRYDVIFSPEYLKGKELLMWALQFQMPFRITSFLYVSNKKVKYVFIKDNEGFAEELYNFMPAQFDKVLVREEEIKQRVKPRNYDRYVFIIMTRGSTTPSLELTDFMPSKYKGKVSTVNIVPDDEEHGTINFLYGYGGENKESAPYLGKESIYGAIFSASKTAYECNLKKALTKIKLVAAIYYDRTSILAGMNADPTSPCYYLYLNKQDHINKLKANSDITKDFGNIIAARKQILLANEALLLKSECTTLY